MKVIAVIPAYNEDSQILTVVESVRPHVDEVVVVDDGSRDQTAHYARKAGAVVVQHVINRGQGAGLQTGNMMALKRGADIVVHVDADGQHPAERIKDLVQPIKDGRAEIVFSSRFLDDSSNTPTGRKWVLKAGLLFIKLLTGLKVTDPQSGFRAVHKNALEKIQIQQDRMAHCSEIFQLVSRHDISYIEVPATITYTDYSMEKGQSSMNAFKIVSDLIKGTLL